MTPELFRRIAAQPAGLVLFCLAAGTFAGAFFLIWLISYWVVPLALAAGLIAARRRWPAVRLKHYFSSLKAVLPALLVAGGVGAQYVLDGCISAGSASGMIAGGALTAAALAAILMVFEGKTMKSIFDLVPADQRRDFADKLDDIDRASEGASGQAADFSALDQVAVAATIKGQVIGQDSAVDAVVSTAFRRARLNRPHKPVAVFLFVGATGAGKTELAKALATRLFDGRLLRVDCNELAAESNVARLIGAPPGYIGSADGSAFCRDLARLGTGVLLLDEVEKAHPAVLKVLMGLLDEGRITEQSTSRTFSARGFVIVATSNAAAAEIGKIAQSETDPTAQAVKVKDALQEAGFLPEVLARIDSVFPFAQLGARALAEIIERFLLGFARDVGVELVSCDAALLIDLVTKAHKTRDYGVREVIRAVESAVVDGLLLAKDQGCARASIRVIDGAVAVEPAEVTHSF